MCTERRGDERRVAGKVANALAGNPDYGLFDPLEWCRPLQFATPGVLFQ